MADQKRIKLMMQIGMKEHPETGVLLYPGDIFEVNPADVMKPPEFGGWLQRKKDVAIQKTDEPTEWVLVCAVRVPDDTPEGLTMRDEPSMLIGINISEKEYLGMERARDAKAGAIHPDVAVGAGAKNVPGVRRR